jgi:PAS domain S-box-containing protein
LLLERLVNDAPIPIAVVEGAELRFVKANPAYCALAGSPDAELVGRTMAEAFPDAAARGSLEPHKRAMCTGERISQKELEFYARASPESPPEPTWWNVTLVPLDSEAGRPASVLIMAEDVTEQVLARRRAEEQAAELRESEELLRLAEHAGNIGSFDWDVKADRLRVSAAYEAIYGLVPGSFVGGSGAWNEMAHPDDLPQVQSRFADISARREPQASLEFRIIRPDGQTRWIEARMRVIYDDEGTPSRVIGINLDITDRKHTEEALLASEELLHLAEHAGNTGSFEWSPQTGRLQLSPGCQAVYGYESEAYDGSYETWIRRLRPSERRQIEMLINDAFAEHKTLHKAEFHIIRPDGQTRWLEGRIRITYDAEGKPSRVVGVKVDITDRKRAEETLRESEERFRLATEATLGVVYDWDRTTGLTWRSARLVDVVGYRPEEVPAENDWWRSLIHPEDLAVRDPTIIPDHTSLRTMEYRVRHKDGHYVWVWDTARVVRDPEGHAVRVIGCTVSINDRKRAEEDLQRLTETLEQRVIERTAIAEQRAAQLRVLAAELTEAEEQERRRLAKILHDHLQQLLVAARIKTAVFRRRAEDDKLSRTLEQIDDVLNQAITESRSLTVELSPPVLYDAGLAAGLDWLARQIEEKHGLRVEVDADPAAEPTDESTRVFLFQTVRELLLNVVKHAQTDLARVELKPLGEDHLRLIVADAGIGFELSALESRGMSGGFGLFSIRERLELLGGRLAVEASPGVGTRMTVDIPRGRVTAAAAVTPAETAAVVGEADGEERRPPSRHEKTRVVLADDHAIVRQGLAGLLREQEAIEVVGEASDGRQAVEITLQTRPDVVLMDVTMPGLNGVEATRRILSSLPQVRVIGLSMHEAADMANAMRKAGAVAYLRKDTDSDVLVSMIQAQAPAAQEDRLPDA